MALISRLASFVLFVPALAVGLLAAGCGSHVTPDPTTGDGGAAGAGGGGGSGGSEHCKRYLGDACMVDDGRACGSFPSETGKGTVQGYQVCQLVPGSTCETQWGACEYNTPLVLSFDGAPVQYLTGGAHAFDVNGAASLVTDWPTARTPWLAIDRDGNGRIDDGTELFGSMTVLSSGARAANGFAALRELDANGDGRITPEDPGFAKLLVWADRDGDRRSAPAELASAASWELLSIDLAYGVEPRCDLRGNCEVERAAFRYRDAAGLVRTGTVIDVHLASQR